MNSEPKSHPVSRDLKSTAPSRDPKPTAPSRDPKSTLPSGDLKPTAPFGDPDATAPAAAPDAAPAVVLVRPDEGETIVLGTTRMRVLEDGSHTEHRLGLAESVLAPHTPGPPQHRHAQHDEGFYIVSGTVRFTVGATDHDATAGTFVMVPPGAPHTFANVTDQPAVMLSILTPDLYMQYFRDLRDLTSGGRPLTPRANIETMSRYATEPVADLS